MGKTQRLSAPFNPPYKAVVDYGAAEVFVSVQMPKRSNEFQKLIFLIKQHVSENTEVTESKMLADLITGAEREVDICVEGTLSGHKVIVGLECRDHKRPADVTWVEQMKSKHERLPTNALVLVSRSGFSAEAVQVARVYGIETLALEGVDQESVNKLFGPLSSLWGKTVTLSPTKVVIRVARIGDLPPENIAVFPDNDIYTDDGKLVSNVKDAVEALLKSERIGKNFLVEGDESHKGFTIEWEQPHDKNGKRLCLQKIDPWVLREIEFIRVFGRCHFEVTQFPLQHGVFSGIRVSWGKGQFMGKDSLLVASENELGEKRLSITTADWKL